MMLRVLAALIVLGSIALTVFVTRADEPVTFSDQVVRILQSNCQQCHRHGGMAPFPLTTYLEAYPFREIIRAATQARRMPPWKPVAGHGEFVDERRLAPGDIDLIARWVAAGAPEGDRRRLPPPKSFPASWMLGEPDLVLATDQFTVPARAGDVYRCFTLPTSLTEDRDVVAIEIAPGNRAIVHHLLTFLDTTGESVELDRREPGPGYTCFGGPGIASPGGLGGWTIGTGPQRMPPDVGRPLPAGARVVVQMHYNNTREQPQTDSTRIGLYLARQAPAKRMRVIPVMNDQFVIPAGASHYEVHASFTFPRRWGNGEAHMVYPHMHLLGREIKAVLRHPDGTTRPLVYIGDWDFNWQSPYVYAKPVPIPMGSRVEVVATYDNSDANRKRPPGPVAPVTWGERTHDEMCIVFVGVTMDTDPRMRKTPSASSGVRP